MHSSARPDADCHHRRQVAGRRSRRPLGVALSTVVLIGASVLVAPVAGATPVAPATPKSSAAATPGPQALPAQSANFPLALQMVDRLWSVPVTDPDAAAAHPSDQLDAGAARSAVATGVAQSFDAVVTPLKAHAYQGLLGRDADSGGLHYWASRIAGGATYESVLRAIASSPEFAVNNPTAADKVTAIYAAMLDRTPDDSGMGYFTGRLDAGRSPSWVVSIVAQSDEYGLGRTDAAYLQVLQRAADPGGEAYWSQVVNRSGWIAVRAHLAASAEFAGFGCDPIAGGSCMLPWPNDYYTRSAPATATGLRVNLKPGELPANVRGTPIDPTQINRSDGFSPGSTLMLQIPGIDVDASGLPTLAHMDRNGSGSPVVLYDTDAHVVVPTWSELDVHDTYSDPSKQLLLIHPARNLTDGHHYVVGLENLKNAAGQQLDAPPVFAAYRDGTTDPVAGFAQRTAHMNDVITTLAGEGMTRADLYLAWDFTVASTANLTGRLVHMRDDAFAQLGSAAPSFTVTSNVPGTHAGIARVVEGTFDVPNSLPGTGAPGSTFNEDAAGLPTRNGTFSAVFRCVVPTSALTTPARASLYGHGLFGSVSEVTAGNVQDMAAEHNMVFCGTNWVGMSNDDIPTAAGILSDLSKFDELADRMQQGVLNFLFLARLMKMSPGLATNAAFQNSTGGSVIAPGNVYYDGNSQGGIEGGVVMAVSQDITRGVLGVSGMNYGGLLLPRSTDFVQFEAILKPSYPSELDRMLGLAAVQLEWDRSEPDGYANHMTTDPLPGTPQHQVLMQIALGDHQVSDYAADTEARTIGAKAHCPAFDEGRVPDTRLLWGIDCIASYPFHGSAIVYFDSGSALPGLTDTPPPDAGDDPTVAEHDPHEDPRNDPAARSQKSAFLMPDAQSAVIDVCNGGPCHAEPQS